MSGESSELLNTIWGTVDCVGTSARNRLIETVPQNPLTSARPNAISGASADMAAGFQIWAPTHRVDSSAARPPSNQRVRA